MDNMMEKIGNKMHMGGHKEEPQTVGAAHAPHYATPLAMASHGRGNSISRRGCATSAIYHGRQLATSDALCRPHGSRYCFSNWSQACNWYFTSQTLSQIFRKPFSVRATVQIVSLHQGPRHDPMKKPPIQKEDPKVDVPREGGVEINQIYENSDFFGKDDDDARRSLC
ncbi:hypothetical protein GOP47_0008467 [Adiantum capillus-veneris]|uniref:Uncharacterized protein n=1 Tax=Adiantum capillus-veneris TaxID=13818 RepID=A0A9D4ZJQ5_ADICA|nr:hypothetical protein GOP47_0008467 [Adiantum capillus-veneris]